MGCDIHIVMEKKHNDNWVGLNAFPYVPVKYSPEALQAIKKSKAYLPPFAGTQARTRNYDLFAALAGVRGDGPDPRGMPDDASDLANMMHDEWGQDGHSHSWLPLEEALPIFAAHTSPMEILEDGYRENICYELFDVEYEDRHKYRLVFWFDN